MRSFVQKHFELTGKKFMFVCSPTVSVTDTLAVLLTDVLVFLQEKDQRFIFAAVVNLLPKSGFKKVFLHPLTYLYEFYLLLSGPEASSNPTAETNC